MKSINWDVRCLHNILGQKLVNFYSDDSLKPSENLEKGKRPGKANKRKLTKLNANQQQILWNLPHSSAT